jgi:hypothetical protein
MSLVTSASIWTNEDNQNKKRQPTMRKTIKMRPFAQAAGEPEEYLETPEQQFSDAAMRNRTNIDVQAERLTPTTIDEIEQTASLRNNRVNEIINAMSSTANVENSGNSLSNFNPISNPSINVKKDTEPENVNKVNPQTNIQWKGTQSGQFSGATITPTVYSNYNASYQGKLTDINRQPYYAKMGISNNMPSDKLLEKINYLISMVEQNQAEKTNNITEEFILYTFLGVFIIFVVDSFSKAAKYTR